MITKIKNRLFSYFLNHKDLRQISDFLSCREDKMLRSGVSVADTDASSMLAMDFGSSLPRNGSLSIRVHPAIGGSVVTAQYIDFGDSTHPPKEFRPQIYVVGTTDDMATKISEIILLENLKK
jgi:hypothetical protein